MSNGRKKRMLPGAVFFLLFFAVSTLQGSAQTEVAVDGSAQTEIAVEDSAIIPAQDDFLSSEFGTDTPIGFDETPTMGLSLYDIWFNRNTLMTGDAMVPNKMMRAEEEFKRFNEARYDQGIKHPKIFSAALVREGYQFLWSDDPISAIDSFTKAIVLDPSNSQAYYGRGKAYLEKSFFNFGTWTLEMTRGYIVGFSDFWITFFRLGNVLVTLFIGIVLWLLALVVFFFIKYASLWNHDVGELIPFHLHTVIVGLIGIMIALLPILMGKGFLILVLFWLILIWVYMDKFEKSMALVLILFLLAMPFILTYGVSFYHMYNNQAVHSMLSTYDGGWDPRVANFLNSWIDRHPSDMEPYYLLGLLYRKQGNYFDAKREYERALRLDASNAKLLNNIGNIYYFLNDYQQAIEFYRKASGYDPLLASAPYNLSKAYLALFEFKKSDEALTQAREIDREKVNVAEEIYSSIPNRKLIDEYLDPSYVWKYFTPDQEENDIRAAEIWRLFVIGLPLDSTATWAIIIVLIAAGLGFLREKFGVARHCVMCGQATCQRCQRQFQSEKYCSNCMQLFGRQDGIDPAMRNEKMLQVQRYKLRVSLISRIMSLIVPGSGHIFSGYSLLGSGVMLVWIYLLSLWGYSGRIFPYPYMVTSEGSMFANTVVILGMIIVYLFSNIHLSRVSATSD